MLAALIASWALTVVLAAICGVQRLHIAHLRRSNAHLVERRRELISQVEALWRERMTSKR